MVTPVSGSVAFKDCGDRVADEIVGGCGRGEVWKMAHTPALCPQGAGALLRTRELTFRLGCQLLRPLRKSLLPLVEKTVQLWMHWCE